MDLVRRFGAEHAFDYSDPECAAEIRRYTGGTLAYTLDCVAMADTTQLCYNAMGRAGGRYVTLEPFRSAITETRPLTIEPSWLLALTVSDARWISMESTLGMHDQMIIKFAVEFTVSVQALLDQGNLIHTQSRL
jgi:Zn-dependent alcohol dehydrogenases, class III